MKKEIKLIVDKKDAGKRLDDFLSGRYHWLNKKNIKRNIEERIISHSSGKTSSNQILNKRDVVKISWELKTDKSIDEIRLKILYEDEGLIAIDKPAKLSVHPTKRYLTDNVIIYLEKRRELEGIKIRLLHRLDRETSGVLLLSKDYNVHREIYNQFERGDIYKEYLALVHGRLEKKEGEISIPIKKGEGRIKLKKIVDKDGIQTKTDYEVFEEYRNFSLLKIIPRTGKGHQIRLHLSHIGHPIVGDKLYGHDEEYFIKYLEGVQDDFFVKDLLIDRHALHASKLRFFHPLLKKNIEVISSLPSDIKELIERIKRDS